MSKPLDGVRILEIAQEWIVTELVVALACEPETALAEIERALLLSRSRGIP